MGKPETSAISVSILFCLLLANGELLGAISDTRTDAFTIEPPAGWRTIPTEALKDYSSNIARLSGGKLQESYQFGYQRDFAGVWLAHPYLLVQINENGRVPEGQLKAMRQLRKGVERGFDLATNAINDAFSDLSLGETVYDPTNKCIWINFSADVAEVGKVRGVTCGYLTQKGAIFFHAYAKQAEFAALAPVFSKAFASVKLRNDLRYVSRPFDYFAFDFQRLSKNTLVGAAVGGVIGLALMLAKLFRSKRDPSIGPPPLPPANSP
jgi:hypothetical protein